MWTLPPYWNQQVGCVLLGSLEVNCLSQKLLWFDTWWSYTDLDHDWDQAHKLVVLKYNLISNTCEDLRDFMQFFLIVVVVIFHRFAQTPKEKIGSRNSSAWQREWSVKFLFRTILSHVPYEIHSLQLKRHMRPLMNPVLRGNVLKYQSSERVQAGEQSQSPPAVWFWRDIRIERCSKNWFWFDPNSLRTFFVFDNQTTITEELWHQNLVPTFSPLSGKTPNTSLCAVTKATFTV